jgi:hypothetical protein
MQNTELAVGIAFIVGLVMGWLARWAEGAARRCAGRTHCGVEGGTRSRRAGCGAAAITAHLEQDRRNQALS